MTNEKNEIIDYIDCLKGFGMLCVIFAHLNPSANIERYIYSFHMPLFFFISGLLRKKNTTFSTSYFIKKVIHLLIPLLVWDLVSVFYCMWRSMDFETILIQSLFLNGQEPFNTPIWFLLVLFMCEVIYTCIYKIPNIVILMISAICSPFISEMATMPFMLNLLPLAIFFYGLGVAISPYFIHTHISRHEKIVLPVLLSISILFGGILNERISFASGYFHNFLFFMIAAIAGIISWTIIFRWLPNNTLLQSLGRQSLFFMCFQYILFAILNSISRRFFSYALWSEINTMKALIVTIFTLAIGFAIIRICNHLIKHFPKLKIIVQYFGIKPSTS